jgi:four helix bundle protein
MTIYAKSIEELTVFQRAYIISLELHKLSLQFPKIEQYSLGDQIRRASKSICANLSEGYARQTGSKKEFRHFILISLGSSDEMKIWIKYARDLGYIDEEVSQSLTNEYIEISKMLKGLYKYIDQQT